MWDPKSLSIFNAKTSKNVAIKEDLEEHIITFYLFISWSKDLGYYS